MKFGVPNILQFADDTNIFKKVESQEIGINYKLI